MTVYHYSSPSGNFFVRAADPFFNLSESYFHWGSGQTRKVRVIKEDIIQGVDEQSSLVSTLGKVVRFVLTLTLFVPILSAILLSSGRWVHRKDIRLAEEMIRKNRVKKESEEILKKPADEGKPADNTEKGKEPEQITDHSGEESSFIKIPDLTSIDELIWTVSKKEVYDTITLYKKEQAAILTRPTSNRLTAHFYDRDAGQVRSLMFDQNENGLSAGSKFSPHFHTIINTTTELAIHCGVRGFLKSPDEILLASENEIQEIQKDFDALFVPLKEKVDSLENLTAKLLSNKGKVTNEEFAEFIQTKTNLNNRLLEEMITTWRFSPYHDHLYSQKERLDELEEQIRKLDSGLT